MYQDMTIKCQSVHLFTRTHDVVDAKRFQEMQKCSEILTDREIRGQLAQTSRTYIQSKRFIFDGIASRNVEITHKRKTFWEIQPTMATDQRTGRVTQDENAI